MKQIPVKVSIEIDGISHSADSVTEDLFIDEENLNEEFVRQPGQFAWYGVLAAEAEHYRDKVKFDLEVLTANLDKQVREELELKGDKVTEKSVETEIGRKPDFKKKKEELLEANRQLKVIKAVLGGIDQKKDMLIQIGANVRKEQESGPKILQEREKEPKPKAVSSKVAKRKELLKKKKKGMND